MLTVSFEMLVFIVKYYKTAKNALVGEIRIDATANGQNLNRPLTTNKWLWAYAAQATLLPISVYDIKT